MKRISHHPSTQASDYIAGALLINAGMGCRAERRGFHSARDGSNQLIGRTNQLHEGEYLQQFYQHWFTLTRWYFNEPTPALPGWHDFSHEESTPPLKEKKKLNHEKSQRVDTCRWVWFPLSCGHALCWESSKSIELILAVIGTDPRAPRRPAACLLYSDRERSQASTWGSQMCSTTGYIQPWRGQLDHMNF